MGYLSNAEETILRKYAEKAKKEAPGGKCQEEKEVYVLRGGHTTLREEGEVYFGGGVLPYYFHNCCLWCFLRGEIRRLDEKPNKVYINCAEVLHDYFYHNLEFSEEYPLQGLSAESVQKATMLLVALRSGRPSGIVEQIMKSVE